LKPPRDDLVAGEEQERARTDGTTRRQRRRDGQKKACREPVRSSRRQRRKCQDYPCLVERVFLKSRWRVNASGGARRRSFPAPMTIPSDVGRSGIRRKVDPQREAERKVKPDAGCNCDGGHIHFTVPHSHASMYVLPDDVSDGTWAAKMVPLSLENGRLGF